MKFRLSGQYGELSPVRGMIPHHGIDLAVPENTVLRSIDNGVVSNVFDGSGLIGKGVAIKTPNGIHEIYGHMNQVKVKIGEHVSEGTVIGLSGNTGNSTAAHLHFGLQNANGTFKDPTYLAEKVSNYAGNDFHSAALPHIIPNPFQAAGGITQLMGLSGEALKEQAREVTTEIIMGIGEAVGELLCGITLVGVGVCVLLKICGWKDGGRWAGILIGVNVLLKFLGVKS